jgi:hypothetical protein
MRIVRNDEVAGSTPVSSTKNTNKNTLFHKSSGDGRIQVYRGPSWPRLRIAVENRITGTIERVETDLRLPVGVLEMD